MQEICHVLVTVALAVSGFFCQYLAICVWTKHNFTVAFNPDVDSTSVPVSLYHKASHFTP